MGSSCIVFKIRLWGRITWSSLFHIYTYIYMWQCVEIKGKPCRNRHAFVREKSHFFLEHSVEQRWLIITIEVKISNYRIFPRPSVFNKKQAICSKLTFSCSSFSKIQKAPPSDQPKANNVLSWSYNHGGHWNVTFKNNTFTTCERNTSLEKKAYQIPSLWTRFSMYVHMCSQ